MRQTTCRTLRPFALGLPSEHLPSLLHTRVLLVAEAAEVSHKSADQRAGDVARHVELPHLRNRLN